MQLNEPLCGQTREDKLGKKTIMNTNGKMSGGVWAITLVLLAGFGFLAWYALGGTQQTALSPTVQTPGGQIVTGSACNFQPTATYSTLDKYAGSAVSGTSYYQVDDNPATTTAYTNVNPGDVIKYWVSNGTYYMTPTQLTASCNNLQFVGSAIQNATATLTGYDTTNSRSIDTGVANISMAASAQANVRFTYQPTARKGFMPFGGVLVLEQNNTIPSSGVTCTAPFITSNTGSNAYTVTYTARSTADAYKVYQVTSAIEDGSGTPQQFNCQYQNGNTAAGAGSAYYVTLIPANYYVVTETGDIVLDVEQAANQLSTRTGLGQLTSTFYWGA